MKTGLCDYYYNGALRYAKDGRLDKALELCAVAWGLSEEPKESEEIRKLTGLCYFALGNYNMADYCFEGLSYYTEDIQKSVREKMEFIDSVSRLINGGQYKKAVKALEDCTNTRASKNVTQ